MASGDVHEPRPGHATHRLRRDRRAPERAECQPKSVLRSVFVERVSVFIARVAVAVLA
ncbi:hypothetical protein MASR2M16_10810 [Thauera terpenica]|jgi:hypothetical protein